MKTEVIEVQLAPPDNARLANLCGAMDDNLDRVARAWSVDIRRRGARFRLAGTGNAPRAAAQTLRALYARAAREISPGDVQLCVAEIHPAAASRSTNGRNGSDSATFRSDSDFPDDPETDSDFPATDSVPVPTSLRRIPRGPRSFSPRGERQREFLEKIRAHDLTICAGPAGTGKTYLAVGAALESVRAAQTSRIILTRPAVEAVGEKLGFLPGDMEQKVNPYVRPLHDALHRLLGRAEAERRIARGAIEIAPLAFMRGLTLDDAFVIADEVQNAVPAQMKMLLTRLGPGAKAVAVGDETQSDLPPGSESGLTDALRRLDGIPGVALHRFCETDVVRHPLVRAVLSAYDDKHDNQRDKRDNNAPTRPARPSRTRAAAK